MTAEGARGCAWRAAGRRCRGCRHADVSRHRTQPYRTVPYHTVSYLTAGTYGKAYLTLSLSKKARGKESRCGKPAKMWKTLWKTCCKALRPLRAGAGAAEHGAVPTGGMCGCGRGFWSGPVWSVLSAGRGPVGAQRWTGAAREGVDAVGQTLVLAAAGRGGAWGSADRGDVRVRQGLLVGHSLARAFGRCGCGGRFWLARCGGRAVRDAGAAQGALAGFLAERKNA